MELLCKKELFDKFKLNEKKLKFYLKEEMPHLRLGNELRFIETEVELWLKEFEPTQEELEKRFVDKKGRTIEEYVLLDKILFFLKIKKDKLYRLCRKGMPFEKVGKKRFFNIEDIVEYFRVGTKKTKEIIKEVKPKNNPQTQTIYVIDGSYDFQTHYWGVGIVKKDNNVTVGYSFGDKLTTLQTGISEFKAIEKTLEIIEKDGVLKSLIYTDQKDFLEMLNDCSLKRSDWMKQEDFKDTFNNIERLLKKLKGSIRFRYAGKLKSDSLPKKFYDNAHVLSRRYQETFIEGFDFSKNTINNDNIVLPSVSKGNDFEETKDITISFFRKKGRYCYYDVIINNQHKVIKHVGSNVTYQAIVLANNFVSTALEKCNVKIKEIPDFETDLHNLLTTKKVSLKDKFKKMVTFLEKRCNFFMENSYKELLLERERELISA